MSLPLTARWEYDAKLGSEQESEEGKLLAVLRMFASWLFLLSTNSSPNHRTTAWMG